MDAFIVISILLLVLSASAAVMGLILYLSENLDIGLIVFVIGVLLTTYAVFAIEFSKSYEQQSEYYHDLLPKEQWYEVNEPIED